MGELGRYFCPVTYEAKRHGSHCALFDGTSSPAGKGPRVEKRHPRPEPERRPLGAGPLLALTLLRV